MCEWIAFGERYGSALTKQTAGSMELDDHLTVQLSLRTVSFFGPFIHGTPLDVFTNT